MPVWIEDDREINFSDCLFPIQIRDTPSGPPECKLNHTACFFCLIGALASMTFDLASQTEVNACQVSRVFGIEDKM